MDDQELFRKMDEDEAIYAPQQLPVDQQERVAADEGSVQSSYAEPPSAAPVANVGPSATPSAAAAPPNISETDPRDSPGAPNPRARDPMGDNS